MLPLSTTPRHGHECSSRLICLVIILVCSNNSPIRIYGVARRSLLRLDDDWSPGRTQTDRSVQDKGEDGVCNLQVSP
jgi:hypothetical protein